jgi:hypothetical protein
MASIPDPWDCPHGCTSQHDKTCPYYGQRPGRAAGAVPAHAPGMAWGPTRTKAAVADGDRIVLWLKGDDDPPPMTAQARLAWEHAAANARGAAAVEILRTFHALHSGPARPHGLQRIRTAWGDLLV